MLHHMLRAAAQRAFSVLDPYFQYVTMLLHGDGTNGAQNNTFLDSSTNNFTITRNGNTTQGTFTPYGSNWSYSGNGSTTYALAPNSTAFDQNAAFTLEWYDFLVSNGAAQAPFYVNTSGYLTVYRQAAGGYQLDKSGTGSLYLSSAYSWSAWHYIAISYDGTNTRFYVDGVLLYTYAGGGVACGTTPELGRGNGGINVNGYISNLRFTKSALYTGSTMTVPTTPLTAITNCTFLAFQSNRWIDNSTNNLTITPYNSPSVQRFSPFSPTTAYSTSVIGGSGYFDGSGDYLTFPNNAALSFGTGDFTIEAWVYKTSASNASIIDGRASNSASPWAFYVDASNFPYFYTGTSYTSTTAILINAWNHVAVTRSSGTLKIFVNGVQGYSATVTTNLDRSSGSQVIGADVTGTTAYWNGYMNDLRVLKGTAQYTSAFTPPTAPLTAITNTSLLLNYTNAGILDNAMMNNLETVGNAQISTSVKKYGTGSMYFDGSGDALLPVASPNLVLGSGNFTVELWVYIISSTSTFNEILDWRKSGNSNGIALIYTASALQVFNAITGAYIITAPTASLNTWYHVAIVRSGSTIALYINGTSVGTATLSSDLTSDQVNIGRYFGGLDYYNGYIDDLRITKGVARYTTTFTPPTAAFPNN
jgi:hypothetical protein